MTLTRRAHTRRPVLHPRLCAVVVAASSAVHVWLAVQNQHGAWLSALMLALAGLCLPCALHIWRHSRVAALHRVMACAVSMAALHGLLLLLAGSGAGGHGHVGTSGPRGIHGTAPDQAGSLLAVVALEMTTALVAATLIARMRPAAREAESALALRPVPEGLISQA